MKTEKLTRAELVRRIAELRSGGAINGDTWQGEKIEPKNYLVDAAAALELLDELPKPALIKETNGDWISVIDDSPAFLGPRHKDLKTVICLAWYQWKTGTRVELTD